jgi:hypothetical protein
MLADVMNPKIISSGNAATRIQNGNRVVTWLGWDAGHGWLATMDMFCSRCLSTSHSYKNANTLPHNAHHLTILPNVLLQKALSARSTSPNIRVWALTNNISIASKGQLQCAWPDGNVTYPTQLLGAVVQTHAYSLFAHLPAKRTSTSPLSPEAIVLGQADAASQLRSSLNTTSALNPSMPHGMAGGEVSDTGSLQPQDGQRFSLSLGYKSSLFELPPDAQDKFKQIQNVTMLQLPQMASTVSWYRMALVGSGACWPTLQKCGLQLACGQCCCGL